MDYQGYPTFNAETNEAVLTVTFDYPPVNVQGIPMLEDLNKLAETLEGDRNVKIENQRNWNDAVIGIQEIK